MIIVNVVSGEFFSNQYTITNDNYSKIWSFVSHFFLLLRQIRVDLFQSIDWSSIDWEKLTPEEKWRLEHMKLHEKHRGHESMHAEMILILFATLVISQIALVKWKQIYPSSYHVSCQEIWPKSRYVRYIQPLR